MKTKERIRLTLKGEIPDRVPVCEISIWPDTIERWKREGLDGDVFDILGMDRITFLGFETGFYFEEKIIREEGEFVIYRDKHGKIRKAWKQESKNYSPPENIDFSLKTKDDWFKFRDYLLPDEKRIPEDIENVYNEGIKRGDFIVLTIEEPAWFIIERTYGFENGLPLLVLEKELCREISGKVTELDIEMCKRILRKGIKPDALWIWSDLCYKNGMFFSPDLYREIFIDDLKRIKNFCEENDLFLIFHCDGYVNEFIPILIESRVDAIQPLEARCGNDVRKYKGIYGDKITLFGNISAEILSSTKEKIRDEIESKLTIAKKNGRYIFHSDHSIPPTVSFENYKYAINLAKEIGKY